MRAIVEPLTFVFGHGFQNDTEDKPMVDLYQMVNTSTLTISRTNLKRFLAITGHKVNTLVVPEQNSGNKKSDQ
jgi:hypothetical protein